MILREATIRFAGYDPDELSKGSEKRVCCSCNGCGRIRWIIYNNYKDLCRSCSQKGKLNHRYGIHHTEKWRKNHSEKMLGKSKTDKHKLNIKKANTGKVKSNKTKKILSDKKKLWHKNYPDVFKGENHPMFGKRGENNPNYTKIILICQQCNNEYKVIKARENTSKFCSKKCKNKWNSINNIGEKSPNWKGGISNIRITFYVKKIV